MKALKLLTLALTLSLGCSKPPPERLSGNSTSMMALIVQPSAYHGKVVDVVGCARMSFEGTALYFHCEDYSRHITENAVWLDLGSQRPTAEQLALEGRYVRVSGRFNSTGRGHFRMFAGTISELSSIEPWPPPGLVPPP